VKTNLRSLGIQLCGRVDIAKESLTAVRSQLLLENWNLDVTILIDLSNKPDAVIVRDEIHAFAQELFPTANFILPERNLGIARSFLHLQASVFSELDISDWAFFLEEDIILEPLHLTLTERLIGAVKTFKSIQRVSIFQGVYDQVEREQPFDVSISEGTKAFAMSKFGYLAITNKFRDLIDLIYANEWNEAHRFALLLAKGFHLPASSKDFIFDECLRKEGLLSVFWNIGLAHDIGFYGQGGSVWKNLKSSKAYCKLSDYESEFELSLRVKYRYPLLIKQNEEIVLRRALLSEIALQSKDSIRGHIKQVINLFGKKSRILNYLKEILGNFFQ